MNCIYDFFYVIGLIVGVFGLVKVASNAILEREYRVHVKRG